MSAIYKLREKELNECTPLERAVRMYMREDAAQELAAYKRLAEAAVKITPKQAEQLLGDMIGLDYYYSADADRAQANMDKINAFFVQLAAALADLKALDA